MATARLDGKKTDERDESGRFAKGHKGGPGRPPRTTERAYMSAISEACPPETWSEIVGRAVKDAVAGDAKSREWLASYLVGKADTAAVTLHQIAVEDEAGVDKVQSDAFMEALADIL